MQAAQCVASGPPPGPPPGPGLRIGRLALLAGLLVVLWLLLQLFASILLPFVAAALIAYFLDPPATRLARLGLPRGGAALLLILALLAAVLVFVLLLYPLILQQAEILIGRVPGYAAQIRVWADQIIDHLQQRLGAETVNTHLRELVERELGSVLSWLAGTLTGIVGGGFALFNVISLLIVTPVVAFYFLRDWPRMIAHVDSWLPRRTTASCRAVARDIDGVLSAWLRGQALCCIALALLYAVALSAAGLDLGLIVGIGAGVLSFIPTIGSIAGFIAAVLLALAQFRSWHGVALVAAIFLAGQVVEGYVIYPRLLGDRVHLHPAWIIFALFAGAAGFGVLGILLAVPVAAAIGVIARFWLLRYLASPLYRDAEPCA